MNIQCVVIIPAAGGASQRARPVYVCMCVRACVRMIKECLKPL
jgi:hypothetical protein